MFGVNAATKLLLYKIEPELHYILKTFLVYLNYVSEELKQKEVYMLTVEMDENIIQILRKL